MLRELGFDGMDAFIEQVVPANILNSEESIQDPLLETACSETEALAQLRAIANKNKVYRSLLGQGYYRSYMPSVILRNVLENPAWYSAYTPYQAEISQGRLEALFNFQTLIANLTGMEIANASLLDEASAAAEAMLLCHRIDKQGRNAFFVDENCYQQTISVIRTRAYHLGISVVVDAPHNFDGDDQYFGCLLQYPSNNGLLWDYASFIAHAREKQCRVVMAADLLALALLKSPGTLGADIAVGSAHRFGVPLGGGGPHAGYMATLHEHRRHLPGRIVGMSVDSTGQDAYCLILQTREQHIRREKATSNICTAQALPAILAAFYAIYHGPEGITQIAKRVHYLCRVLADRLKACGFTCQNEYFFDTLSVETGNRNAEILKRAERARVNLYQVDAHTLRLSLDEATTMEEVRLLLDIFSGKDKAEWGLAPASMQREHQFLPSLARTDKILDYPQFKQHHSETQMMRYMRSLADKDLALDRGMIPLGSCTMKLNASSEMLPISWPEFADMHPFAPQSQTQGYQQLVAELERMLCVVTGYAAGSIQPNAGSQGEYAGLLAVRAYHASRKDEQRRVCLIPVSAHGTNPATARMCGLEIVSVDCDKQGNIDIENLKHHLAEIGEQVALIMLTYPSTHGVFESHIVEVCQLVHKAGALVYIDGANLNAMVGLCLPGKFGGDVSHLNLHKTFCIPHGGGGPGVGPVMLGEKLRDFLPKHPLDEKSIKARPQTCYAVSASQWGSAGILPISWMYMKMMGAAGLRHASEIAILNANYIAAQLKSHYPILYQGEQGWVAHECIVDLRPIAAQTGIDAMDVAKRLMDYGFHAPTVSFPVAGTIMIEPTESESKEELDRFCDAMLAIRKEIESVANGTMDKHNNPLKNAPHTACMISADNWDYTYTRMQAAQLDSSQTRPKYWPPVARIDYTYGERNPSYVAKRNACQNSTTE